MLAKKLHDLNERGGMTEAELAREIGISQPSINRIKLGKQIRVSYDVGKRIDALWELRFGAGAPQPANEGAT